ncbi:MAG: hypothetical protein JXR90_11700 [Spirochaetes bacterium]|nr:hypothetical protein [Spirochaetota bacterium]
MKEYVNIIKYEKSLIVSFNIEEDKVLKIGEKMNELNDEAYMNGYNWEAFLDYYLNKNYPDVIRNMDTDSEAGMYTALYELNPDNEIKAKHLAGIIEDLIENEEKLYKIINEEGESIDWD